jgi:hypothetical protein
MSDALAICVICGYATHADDWATSPSAVRGRVICLRCYARETNTSKRTPKRLIRDVEDAQLEP